MKRDNAKNLLCVAVNLCRYFDNERQNDFSLNEDEENLFPVLEMSNLYSISKC